MPNSPERHAPHASGRAILIDALVDIEAFRNADEHSEAPGGWTSGVAEFALRPSESTRFIQNRDSGVVGELDRRENFSEVATELLYGTETPEQGLFHSSADPRGGSLPLRWHTRPGEALHEALRHLGNDEDGVPFGLTRHRITQIELVISAKFASAPTQQGFPETRRAILILHLQPEPPGKGNPSEDRIEFNAGVAREQFLLFRQAAGRIQFLKTLQGHIGTDIRVLEKINGHGGRKTAEDYGGCYPVLTDLDLKFYEDDQALLIRELATVTPSKDHGAVSDAAKAARLKRTRDQGEWTFLSDSWSMMATRHGVMFFGTDVRDYGPARLYVSTLYLDLIALARLESLLLQDLLQETQRSIQRQGEIDTSHALLQRRRLMGLKGSYDKAHHTENNTGRTIIEQMREIFRTQELVEDAADDLKDIVEVASLKSSKHEEWTNRLITLLLGALTFAGVPMTVFYTWLQVRVQGSESEQLFWWITGSVVALVLVVGIVTVSVWNTKKPKRDN